MLCKSLPRQSMEVQHQPEGILRWDGDQANNQGFGTSKKARGVRPGGTLQANSFTVVHNHLVEVVNIHIWFTINNYFTILSSSQERAADDDLLKDPKELKVIDESGLTPEPEKMGEKVGLCWFSYFHYMFCILQVLPDLQKFMDSMHNRILQCQKLGEPVELHAGQTVAGKEFLCLAFNNWYMSCNLLSICMVMSLYKSLQHGLNENSVQPLGCLLLQVAQGFQTHQWFPDGKFPETRWAESRSPPQRRDRLT